MPTILHLITGLEAGGAERMLVRLAGATDRDRFRSVVVSMTDRGSFGPVLEAAGVELRLLGMRRGRAGPAGLSRLGQILREVRPDLVQSWLYHADFLALIARLLRRRVPRLVWNIQCTDMRGDGLSRTGAVLRRLLAWSAAIPDAIVVNSRAGQEFHRSIGYRARCHPMKRPPTFLAAAARLAASEPRVRFVLSGTGADPGNRQLSDAVAGLGIADRVILLGERRDMPSFFAALDICALSSAYGEGCPNVLGEAMPCGAPCAATDVGDTADVIGDSGTVVPARDPAALAAGIERLIGLRPEGRQAIGAQARARIEQEYELGKIVARYEALYKDLAAR